MWYYRRLPDGLVVMQTRPEHAPQLEQLQRVCFPTLDDAERFKAEHYRHPFLTAQGTTPAGDLRSHAGPVLDGDPSVMLTAFQPRRARIVNESSDAQTVRFAGQQLDLRPWEIRTISI